MTILTSGDFILGDSTRVTLILKICLVVYSLTPHPTHLLLDMVGDFEFSLAVP
jgi:hypothetical protein